MNTESVFLKPQAIRHLFPQADPTTNEESKNEESKEATTAGLPRKESEEQQLWGGLLSGEAKIPFRIE